MRYTYILNMAFVQALVPEVKGLQCFHKLIPVDPKRPLTSIKINRVPALMGYSRCRKDPDLARYFID